jgi:hypothetical protein
MLPIPVFIGGTGRSGTTIALNLLARSSQVQASMPRELRYLTDRKGLIDLNYKRPVDIDLSLKYVRNSIAFKLMPLLGKNELGIFISRMRDKWWEEVGKTGKPRGLVQGVDLLEFETALEDFKRNFKRDKLVASRKLFYELAMAQISDTDIRLFADSTPPNILNSQYLSSMFPEAKFINMVRDGRDVALSVTREPWGPSNPMTALEWWKKRTLKGHLALANLKPEKVLTIRLENLVVLNREKSFGEILQHVGIPAEKRLREYFDTNLTAEKMSQGNWRDHVSDPSAFDRRYQSILRELESQGCVIKAFY